MATLRFDNPFHDLWVTEILDPGAFVKMFSDTLVRDAEALFSAGNIVLKGRQGSGKSMLLTLLETTTRVAYASTHTEYPVPIKQRNFLSAGVQLTQQSAALVAARAAELPVEKRQNTIAANFSDYLNSLLCRDLLKNIQYLSEIQARELKIIRVLPIDLGMPAQRQLFSLLNLTESWPEVLGRKCDTVHQAIEALDSRLRFHRQYANGTIEDLPLATRVTRSPAGIPMAELAASLRAAGVLPAEALVLLRVDQHEELFELERHTNLGSVFRRVLNSMLARRDPRVAYRIGTRHYAWEAELTAWGSGAPLEQERDYGVVDLDLILRRGEHSTGWKFPALAKDVLDKRLRFAGFHPVSDPMAALFGSSIGSRERAKKYVSTTPSAVKVEAFWAPEWKGYLDSLWMSGQPLDAKFGEAWLRQESQTRSGMAKDGSLAEGLPWRRSPWWAKERSEIALMQLAGDRQQALVWSGERQVIDLSGSNILAFMTICKSVWATWQRRNPNEAERHGILPAFSVDDQAIGIAEASQIWFKKIQVGLESDQRVRLISALGSWFRRRMLEDRKLAYPGHNGFSLRESELGGDSEILSTIKVCRDHGDLMESPHTTRNKSQERRIKWYLHPLLSPLFRIPHARTKEPIYSDLKEIEQILTKLVKPLSSAMDSEAQHSGGAQLRLPGLD